MIGSKSKNQNSGTQKSPVLSSTCVLSMGSQFTGNFSSKEDVRLDGTVDGEIRCENRLVMGETGHAIGIVYAKEAVIHGKIEGDITVKTTLVLKKSAQIIGKIQAQKLSVEEGAMYNGECKIGD